MIGHRVLKSHPVKSQGYIILVRKMFIYCIGIIEINFSGFIHKKFDGPDQFNLKITIETGSGFLGSSSICPLYDGLYLHYKQRNDNHFFHIICINMIVLQAFLISYI